MWVPCKISSKDRPNLLFFSQETHLLVTVDVNNVRSQAPEFASFVRRKTTSAFYFPPHCRHRAPNMVIGDTGHEWECSGKYRLWTNALYSVDKKPTRCHFCVILYFYIQQWDHHPHNHTQPTHRETYLNNTTHCYSTYQHVAITLCSRQLLKLGTWLPETCWATIRREIKNTKSDI